MNKKCISLLAREFWLNGEISSHCCCFFIGFDDGTWLKALYNDELCLWELIDSDEVPDINNPVGDKSFYYPYKEYMPKELDNCGALINSELQNNNKLIINFSSNLQVVLQYDPIKEEESIEIRTA
ncbi:MAG: hypothetical protein OEY96_03280 [Gammaproteobacteria bacterium]|nr:hypothetical protein [Gammaproteobacteria bacterium]